MESANLDARYLYEHSPVGHIVFKQDGTILHITDTLQHWLEADDKEWLTKKPFTALLSRAGQLYYHMVLQQLLTIQKSVQEISLDMVTLKGNRFPCLFSAKAVEQKDSDQLLFHAAIVKTDDRKKYERELVKEKEHADRLQKKLHFITNNIPVLSFTLLPNGEMDFLNDRFCEYLRIRKDGYVSGAIFKYMHPADVLTAKALWKRAIFTKTKFEKELRIRNVINEYEWFLGHIMPYKNEAGEVKMWLGTFVNITKQKRKQEQKIEQLHFNLLDANETISKNGESFKQIAFDQSHIVRRPLANILAIALLFAEVPMNEEVTYQNP